MQSRQIKVYVEIPEPTNEMSFWWWPANEIKKVEPACALQQVEGLVDNAFN